VTNARGWIALVALAALTAAGCGYTMEPLHRTDVHSVAVSIFSSKEFRRNLEFNLSERVVKNIELHTPYKVIHDPKRADTELRGEIILLSAPVLTESLQHDRPQDIEVTVTCWFEWKDLRTGAILARRERLAASASYAPALSENQESATNLAMERLAVKIVEAMEKEW